MSGQLQLAYFQTKHNRFLTLTKGAFVMKANPIISTTLS